MLGSDNRGLRDGTRTGAGRPSFRELEAFRAVLEYGKTTAAAQRLGVSQPAVSRALAQLEARLGRTFFLRAANRLTPTADALAFNQEIDPIFQTLTRIRLGPGRGRGNESLRLIAGPTLAHNFLNQLIPRFHDDLGIFIHLEIGATPSVVFAVADGQADLGITDSRVEHDAVISVPFRRARARAVMPPGHPLAEKPVVVPADFHGHRFVALNPRLSVRTVIDGVFEEAGADRIITVETATSLSACDLVRAGMGVSVLNPFPLSLAAADDLVFRPFEPDVCYETRFVLPARGRQTAEARHFMEFIKTHQPEDGYTEPIR